MRIQGPYGTNSATQANGPRRASGSGFSLPDTESVTQTRPASAARGVNNIDALMALRGRIAQWLAGEPLHGSIWRAGLPRTLKEPA